MADQLDRIAELADLPNVSIRIMPFTVGLHYGIMSGPFVMLEFPLNANNQHSEPPTVYVDSFTGALFLDKPHEIDQYNNAFKDIWTTALDEVNSKKMIIKAAQELRK